MFESFIILSFIILLTPTFNINNLRSKLDFTILFVVAPLTLTLPTKLLHEVHDAKMRIQF